MSVIQQLHYIKAFREQKAEAEMVKSRLLLAQAHRTEDEAREALEAQRAQARAEELRLYRELCERVVRLREITRVQEEVLGMGLRTREHQQRLAGAEQARVRAREDFDGAYQHYQGACTARQKFESLMHQETQRAVKEAERREELEMEETAGNLRDRHEYEEHTDVQ